MDSQRRKFVILIVVVSLITFGWITVGTGTEEVPYVSIEELLEKQGTWKQDRFRMGGLVKEGSIAYSSDRLHVEFTLFQDDDRLSVHYTGLTPDMFRDGAEVIIEGQFHEGIFLADNLMTKCASRYEVDLMDPSTSAYEDR